MRCQEPVQESLSGPLTGFVWSPCGQTDLSMSRHYDPDALRAFAMLLGILLHASVFLLPPAIWPPGDYP